MSKEELTLPATGERHQRKGKEGLEEAKLWLESTTRFFVPFTSWGKAGTLQYVEVPQYGRNPESFDLFGQHLEEDLTPRAEFFAEVKRYASASDQRQQYREFLTRCYSATLAWVKIGAPRTPEFMWITWHPFGTISEYRQLTEAAAITEACEKLPQRVKPEDFDPALAEDISGRLWLLIASPRLDDMRMSKEFLGLIRAHSTEEG